MYGKCFAEDKLLTKQQTHDDDVDGTSGTCPGESFYPSANQFSDIPIRCQYGRSSGQIKTREAGRQAGRTVTELRRERNMDICLIC